MLSDETVRALVENFQTPLYVFDESVIRRQCQRLKSAIRYPHTRIRYACKALTLRRVLEIIRSEGYWADASSLFEAKRAIQAGFSPAEILYTGEEASATVFRELCSLGVQINCSSLDQVQILGEVAPGTTVSVRVNPGEGHGANKKVNTGGPASKHGIYFDQLDLVHDLVGRSKLNLVGIHAHIGSGTDLEHWLRIKDLVLAVARTIKTLRWVNLGGGLPVVYNTDTDNPMPLTQWGEEVSKAMVEFSTDLGRPIELQLEPGRFLVAESGYLIAEVQNIKRTPSYTFALVNSGLNHNIRPAMYGAYHPISFVPREDRPASKAQPYVIAGCLCESGDVFTVTEDEEPAPRMYPELRLGDLMVMGAVGAYSHSMKSDYNSIPFPASVLLTPTGEATILERRGTLDDIVRREVEAGV